MGYRLGYEQSRPRPFSTRWTLWYTAGTQHTRASTSRTDGEGDNQTEDNLARHRVCLVPAQRQAKQIRVLAGMNRTRRSKRVFLLTWLQPPPAAHAPWERSLLARARAPCWTSDQPYAVSQEVPHSVWLIAQHTVEHSSSHRGVQIRVVLLWFSCWFPHEKSPKLHNHDKVAHRMTMWWLFLPVENLNSSRFQSQIKNLHSSRPKQPVIIHDPNLTVNSTTIS